MAINGEEARSPGRETIEDDSASDGIDLNARASSSLARHHRSRSSRARARRVLRSSVS